MIIPKIEIRPGFYIWLSLMVLLLPFRWLAAWGIAMVLHECFHYYAILRCGGTVPTIILDIYGAKMITEEREGKEGLFCALAGPMAGIILFLFLRWIPRLALCGLAQSAYNLLPIGSLDGARALRCFLLRVYCEEKAERIRHIVNFAVLLGLAGICVYCAIWLGLGLMPAFVLAMLVQKCVKIKFPCNHRLKRVQ